MPPEARQRYFADLLSMPETHELCAILLDRGFVESPTAYDSEEDLVENPSEQNTRWATCMYGGLFEFIQRYLQSIPKLHFDPEIFNRLYADFEQYHLSDEVPFTSTVPLQGFSADEDCITFDADTRIIRLGHSQITRLASRGYFRWLPTDDFGLSRVKEVFSAGFAIQITYRLAKGQPISIPVEHEEADRILTAVRLVRPGNASHNIIFTGPSAFYPLQQAPTAGWTEPLIHKGLGEALHLLTNDVGPCQSIWDSLNKLSQQKKAAGLDVAVRKFNELYQRRSLEDRIIDMSILLESTLLHGQDRELRYRLALRGAHLLKSTRPTKETFALLKKFYDLRSKIVHQGQTLDAPVQTGRQSFPAAEFVAEMHSLCREVLHTFVTRLATGESIDAVIETLNDAALSEN